MKLKTRTNQPVYYKLPVSSNIQSLSDDLLNSLKVGDVVQKKTGNQKHCYIVTYKEEKHGICLTYVDCGYMETISYDYTDGHWVYNSKDVQETQEKLVSGTNIKTIGGQSILGSGNIAISGGTKLYGHEVLVTMSNETRLSIQVVSVTPTISTGFVDEPSMGAILQAGIIAMYIDETYVPVKQSDLIGAEEAEVLEDYEIPYNE